MPPSPRLHRNPAPTPCPSLRPDHTATCERSKFCHPDHYLAPHWPRRYTTRERAQRTLSSAVHTTIEIGSKTLLKCSTPYVLRSPSRVCAPSLQLALYLRISGSPRTLRRLRTACERTPFLPPTPPSRLTLLAGIDFDSSTAPVSRSSAKTSSTPRGFARGTFSGSSPRIPRHIVESKPADLSRPLINSDDVLTPFSYLRLWTVVTRTKARPL